MTRLILVEHLPIAVMRAGAFVWRVDMLRGLSGLLHFRSAAALCGGVFIAVTLAGLAIAQQGQRPAFVIVERTATTGPESVQQEYAKLAREILPKYGGHYLARSQNNTLLEGDGVVPCCMAILQFPSLDAARRWYRSPENQEAAKVRESGGKFRLIAIEGLPSQD